MLPSYREIAPGDSYDGRFKMARRTTVPWGRPVPDDLMPERVRVELGWSDEPLTLHADEHSLCTYAAGLRVQARERGIAVQSSR